MWRFYHVAIIARIALEGLKYYYYYYSRDSFFLEKNTVERTRSKFHRLPFQRVRVVLLLLRNNHSRGNYDFPSIPLMLRLHAVNDSITGDQPQTPRNSSLWKYFYPLLHFHRDRSGFVTVTVSIDVFFPPLPSPINFLSQKFDHTLFRSRRRN